MVTLLKFGAWISTAIFTPHGIILMRNYDEGADFVGVISVTRRWFLGLLESMVINLIQGLESTTKSREGVLLGFQTDY